MSREHGRRSSGTKKLSICNVIRLSALGVIVMSAYGLCTIPSYAVALTESVEGSSWALVTSNSNVHESATVRDGFRRCWFKEKKFFMATPECPAGSELGEVSYNSEKDIDAGPPFSTSVEKDGVVWKVSVSSRSRSPEDIDGLIVRCESGDRRGLELTFVREHGHVHWRVKLFGGLIAIALLVLIATVMTVDGHYPPMTGEAPESYP